MIQKLQLPSRSLTVSFESLVTIARLLWLPSSAGYMYPLAGRPNFHCHPAKNCAYRPDHSANGSSNALLKQTTSNGLRISSVGIFLEKMKHLATADHRQKHRVRSQRQQYQVINANSLIQGLCCN